MAWQGPESLGPQNRPQREGLRVNPMGHMRPEAAAARDSLQVDGVSPAVLN